MLTKADREAQRLFLVNPSAHIHRAIHYIMGRKQVGEICQVFRHCQSWPGSLLKASGPSLWQGQANGDRLEWGGGGPGPHLPREAVLLSQPPGEKGSTQQGGREGAAPSFSPTGLIRGGPGPGVHTQTLSQTQIICHPHGCAAYPFMYIDTVRKQVK